MTEFMNGAIYGAMIGVILAVIILRFSYSWQWRQLKAWHDDLTQWERHRDAE